MFNLICIILITFYFLIGITSAAPHAKGYIMSKKIAAERRKASRITTYGVEFSEECVEESKWWENDAREEMGKAVKALLWNPIPAK